MSSIRKYLSDNKITVEELIQYHDCTKHLSNYLDSHIKKFDESVKTDIETLKSITESINVFLERCYKLGIFERPQDNKEQPHV